MNDLKNNPDIAELIEILDKNGLLKEKQEVNELVDYIGNMENRLSDMMSELTEMRKEVRQIHDSTLRSKTQKLVENTLLKVTQAAKMVKKTKDNLITGAKIAIQAFKVLGKNGLITAVEIMKIPKVIGALQNCFAGLSHHMERNANKMETFRSELGEAGTHIKNAGQALLGRTSKESKEKDDDKGILSKFRKMFEGMSKSFAAMEKRSKSMTDRLQGAKASVKSDLAKLKETQNRTKATPEKEPER